MQTAVASPKPDLKETLKRDLPASLVVFLVAVPLSLGIALASGAPIMAGLIAAAVGGIVVGLLGGAPLQVSGPAAGLTVLVFTVIQQHGWGTACLVTVLAGLIQLGLGFLRVSRAALAITPAVVHGMLAGIGVTIALAQLHVVLGGSPESSALKNLHDLPAQVLGLHTPAAVLGLITFGLLAAWPKLPKRVRAIPGALGAVAVGTLVAEVFHLDVKRVDLPDNLLAGISLPTLPTNGWGPVIVSALTIAVVASVESLLSAVATDKMHTGKRANLDRELVGQGAANTISGLLGGLPVTGVIVRSSANINAGAKSRLSATLHGVWIVLFVALLGSTIERIPLSVLAGLLVYVGMKLVSLDHIRELTSHREAPIYFATLAGVVGLNLLAGVGIGIAMAVFMLLRRMSHVRFRVRPEGEAWRVAIDGSLTFMSLPKLNKSLSEVPAGAEVHLELHVDYMDHAAFEALHSWEKSHELGGGKVYVDEVHEDWYSKAKRTSGHTDEAKAVRPEAGAALGRIVSGIAHFHERDSRAIRPRMERLVREGQKPHALFITCADSRILPSILTNTDPGELFVIRNVGNLVPPEGADGHADAGIGAALEYALEVLKVSDIIVMGHSSCGAMGAVLKGGSHGRHLDAWLRHGDASKQRFGDEGGLDSRLGPADQLSQHNALEQVRMLETYPEVATRVRSGDLKLHAWWFHMETSTVTAYDPETNAFLPVEAVYSSGLNLATLR